jgi:hypothetical protein
MQYPTGLVINLPDDRDRGAARADGDARGFVLEVIEVDQIAHAINEGWR